MTAPSPCPCDTGKPYPSCCGRFHDGRPAPTAVALMRSRYSAFALGLGSYLLETWHPATRPPSMDLDDDTTWTGLTIEHTEAGKAAHPNPGCSRGLNPPVSSRDLAM